MVVLPGARTAVLTFRVHSDAVPGTMRIPTPKTRRLGINDLNLLESLFDGIERSPFYVKDLQLRYKAANGAMAALCGARSPKDMIDKKAEDYYAAPDASRFEAIESAVLRSGQSSVTMLDFIAGKRPAWLVYSNHPLFDNNGSVAGVAGTSNRLDRRDFEDRVYQRVLAVSEWLRSVPSAPMDIAALAAQAGTSVSQLQRDFQKVFRIPVRRFLAQLRLAKARELLFTDLPITDVAHEVGFTDHSAFSRRFQAEFGMTPSAFRSLRLPIPTG